MRNAIYKTRPVAPTPARFGGERINDFIVMSEGFSNCYLIETAEGNIQLNAGMGFEAPVHAKNFADFSAQPLHSLILTQGHVDHVGGVDYFRQHHPGLTVIAQAGNAEHQAYDARLSDFRGARSAFAFTDKFNEIFAYYREQGYNEYPPQAAPRPDVLVAEKHRFSLGGLDVELIAVPGAETNDSLIVWLPQHKICFTGNLFGCPFGHFPNLATIRGDRYRDALVVARAVETVLALQPEMIVYGHHHPVIGAKLILEELTALHGAILYVHDETVKGMNEGKSVHQLMQQITLPPELEVGQGYGKVSWGVRSIWEHYAGWFHHQSTTELFAVPRSEINRDLLELAGGPLPLIRRAAQKLANKQHEQALHLLDIVLAESPANSAALELAVATHQALLRREESRDNFWLSSWLTQQIQLLEKQITTGADAE